MVACEALGLSTSAGAVAGPVAYKQRPSRPRTKRFSLLTKHVETNLTDRIVGRHDGRRAMSRAEGLPGRKGMTKKAWMAQGC